LNQTAESPLLTLFHHITVVGEDLNFFLWHKMPYLTVEEKMSKDIFAEKIAEKLPPKAFAFYF
jgi:hypothetical protein